jgi:sugar phosphate isomerase/epimerase
MDKLFNLTIYGLAWFNNDWQELKKFCQENDFAGIELLAAGLETSQQFSEIPADLVKGLHLSYQIDWLGVDNDQKRDFKELINNYQRELEMASQLEVDYVVFHAGNSGLEELLKGEFRFSNTEVLSSLVEIINQVLVDSDFDFKLLFENLWVQGLDLLDPLETINFFKKINSKQAALILDTGHLLNTAKNIKTEQEAIDYIEKILITYPQANELFVNLHLHKSLSVKNRLEIRNKMYQKFKKLKNKVDKEKLVGTFISKVDQHLPFTEVSPKKILEIIEPDYVIHEFVCLQKEEFINNIKIQNNLL